MKDTYRIETAYFGRSREEFGNAANAGAPKELHNIAQGFSPGEGPTMNLALKGRPNWRAINPARVVISKWVNPFRVSRFAMPRIEPPISAALSGRVQRGNPPGPEGLGYPVMPFHVNPVLRVPTTERRTLTPDRANRQRSTANR